VCLARELETADPSGGLLFDENGIPIAPSGDFQSTQNSDVKEFTWAGYVQGNFSSDLGSTPIRGNVGLRVINTKVESVGFRTTLTSSVNATNGEVTLIEDTNNLTAVQVDSSYTEFLPSFNLVAEFTPEVLGRFAVFRALSRPDPTALGFGRQFASANQDDDAQTIVEALGVVSATGNPRTDPLLSWNVDLGLEWYPNDDTILALNAYYKSFNGGFETVAIQETFLVDDAPVQAFVNTVNTTNDTSTIYGLEVTAAHRLSWLPQPLDGLGFKLSYNYANSDFEFQDDTLGALTQVNLDGSITTQEALIAPADIFGLSKHVLSAQAYYEIGDLELQGIYKYRSQYFQQFVATPGRVRFVDDVGVFEARISYNLSKNVKFTLEGLNLFNEPRTDLRGTTDNFGQISVYGPRYFAGVRAKF
jgi:iron complex outermembrane recepter protein